MAEIVTTTALELLLQVLHLELQLQETIGLIHSLLRIFLDNYTNNLEEGFSGRMDSSPYTVDKITVPPGFLRTEYMIGYTFMGVMYGLGFLVLFQSLLIPVAKGLTFLLYMWLLYLGHIEPVTLSDALQQLPPD